MHNNRSASLTKLSWADIRSEVEVSNPSLASLIDAIDPDPSYALYLARYPYGSLICQQGELHVANEQQTPVPITDRSVHAEFKKDLHYQAGLPVGLSLDKSFEAFHSHANRTVPLQLWQRGDLFGLEQQLDIGLSYHCASLSNISAGARSLFMLPKITDSNSQKRLNRAFDLRYNPPKQLHEQWPLFVDICQHTAFPKPWHCELLFFSNKWFEPANDGKDWLRLKNYFLEQAWRQSNYWRHKHMGDLIFSHVQANRNLKPNPHLADAAKQLLHIAAGAAPGFAVAEDDDAAPMSGLQDVYTDIYQLKHYAPVLMTPKHFAIDVPKQSVYYSLHMPTSLEFSPKSRNLSSTMGDLHEIKHIMDTFQSEMLNNTLKAEQTPFYKQALHVQFDYFHSEEDKYNEVRHSRYISEEDAALTRIQQQFPEKTTSESSPFVRGCVRVSSNTLE